MDIAIIILGIIFIIIIIIFISLISYNMYKLSNINNEQQKIIKIIEDKTDKRFSNSIFMTNMKNIFFKFNHHLINDILRKICKDSNSDDFFVKCNEDSTETPLNDREFDDGKLKKYNAEINHIWKIIITTIEKIETPFYHKYTDNELDNMIKGKLNLNKFIEIENQVLLGNRQNSLIIESAVKIYYIYIEIIFDMIKSIINDKELRETVFNKFKLIIETIIIKFLADNFEDIKSMINTGTKEGNNDILRALFDNKYAKFNEINLAYEFDDSIDRYYVTPKYRNKESKIDDEIQKNLQRAKKLNDDFIELYPDTQNDGFSESLYSKQNDDVIQHIGHDKDTIIYLGVQPAEYDPEILHVFRLFKDKEETTYMDTMNSTKFEMSDDFIDVFVKEENLHNYHRQFMIAKNRGEVISPSDIIIYPDKQHVNFITHIYLSSNIIIYLGVQPAEYDPSGEILHVFRLFNGYKGEKRNIVRMNSTNYKMSDDYIDVFVKEEKLSDYHRQFMDAKSRGEVISPSDIVDK